MTTTNKYYHILLVALLLLGAVDAGYAQTETRVISIGGNVYGGGEAANVGSTEVTINEGAYSKNIFGGGEGVLYTAADETADPLHKEGTVKASANVTGSTNVTINGGEFDVKHLDAHDPRILTDFAEHYNIYGGGNIASSVGETHVYVKKGMISKDSDGSGFGNHNNGTFLQNSNEKGIAQVYYQRGQMYFCIFGGGYGKNTSVTGNTWVDFNLNGMTDINSTAIEDDLLEYQSWLDVVGGGFNGTVQGNTNVHVGGNAMCRDVYGGGLYATIGTQGDAETGKTNVYITGGNVDNVYGGGVMGDILSSTNVNIGLHDALNFDGRKYAVDNDKVTVLMSVFGGNDVSGRVETANVNHYGGTIDQDIYGAGNGNYRGYYTPGVCDYADGDNDNYYPVDHSGETSTDGKGTTGPKGNTYKGRPQTGAVNIKISGNSTSDKASVLGQVFGGGNSCTIGDWVTPSNEDKYEGDPHKWRDDPAYFLGGGSMNITLGNHVKIGRSHKELVDAGDEEYLNKDGENVSGLFMGCSGKFLATQETAEDDYVYHHYYDRYTAKYWPGFAVFKDNGEPMNREEGLAAYNAYLNNILIWSDNVRLHIADDAEDIWLANFVGGGFRGSMKAETAAGRFAYTLPEGVTIGNAVVGGAYNTDVVYRVFDTEEDMHTYKTTTIDDKTHYLYRTTLKPEWTQGTDYHHVEYAEDGHTITGIVRFYYDGGMLSHDNSDARIHQVHADPRASAAEYATAYFEPMTSGSGAEDEATKAKLFSANKNKSFVYLNLRCALEPEVLSDSESNHSVHGGNVFGGCFMSGLVQGDSWVDYGAWLSPNCTNTYYFDKTNNMHIYSEAADLVRNNALNVFGAGYGENTHTAGDTYLYIKAVAQVAGGDGNKNGKFPYMFNAFGGSYAGRVYGNTNVYYASGKQGTLLGSLYGGGFKGDIDGNTFVELAEGFVTNVYGGSRQANIGGAAHVWAYDGKSRGITDANHLIICNLYGGNDIAGNINGTMPAKFTETKWGTAPTGETLTGKLFNSYVEISADDGSADRGFPLVGSAYAGGNGAYDYTSRIVDGVETNPYASLEKPTVPTALLEIDGGSTFRAFGGGNNATVTEDTYIFTNAQSTQFANVTFSEYQKNIMQKVFFNGVTSGYTWENTTLRMDQYHVANLYGGNNLATMTIQPTWNLKKGKIENVYSGGNMGDMTYYNALAGTTGHETEAKGLSITVNSDDINIESLYGGCRMSDVNATLYTKDGEGNIISATPQTFGDTEYGATVNVIKGHIGNVYGGNDISGYVYNGTNVNLSGSITGNVYGAGNGNYLYAYDRKKEHVTSGMAEVWNDEVNQYVYWIPGTEGDSKLKQIVSLTNARPHVSKAYLNIHGQDEDNKVYIFGSVYCGGNASTIRPMPGDETEAHVKFNIGNNVIVNEVFMGSNGASLKYDANDKDNKYLTNFEKVNKLDFSYNMTEADYGELLTMNGLAEDKRALIEEIYPNLLSVYMSAVDMKAMPLGFTEFSGHTFKNTWIGTFCMGGNAGSMMTDQPVDIVFPQSLKFFGRIIGGSKDASFQYKGKWHRGGFRMPLASGATLKDDKGVDQPTKSKLRMKIRGDWYSRRMNMDAKYKDVRVGESPDGDYLVYDKTDNGVDWKIDGKAWHDGCNVYGGCYQSGDMQGDVEIYIESDMLAYSDPRYGTTIDTYVNQKLVESNKLNIPVANVYGAGYGPESRSFGDAYIYMKDIPNVASHHPSVNNIFGGGRNGMLVGNSVIHVHDGLVFKDVVGGSFAAPMYGSSQVTVGYPKFYVCKQSGEYFLDRADKWNEGYTTKGNNKTESVIKNSIKYFEGTYVPCNVYDLITGVKLHGSDDVTDLSGIHTAERAGNTFFDYHDESIDASLFPTGGWNKVEIRVRGGVYGGGFSLSNSTAALAGSYTTLASTEEYNHGTDSQGNSSVGYGGNSSIIISDQGTTADHIKISTENPVVNGIYSGTGGIYGDGRLVFCEGFRAAELNGYGYAEHTPSNPLMLNSLQRLDLLTVNDCCFNLYGDQDFATDELKAQKYSLARIGELRMNSSIAATATYATGNLTSANSRNYIGFYNNIHYLGCIVTNDDFHTAKFHDETGALQDAYTYRSKKQEYITNYNNSDKQEAATNIFKQRNYATARNMVGISSGFCLRVENQYYDNNERKTYYGPIVGVAEVKLLNVQPGEGGGYVYADNIHADIYQSGRTASDATFMNESGNFVFEGVHRPDDPDGEKQFIVDDCLPKGFDDWKAGRAVASELPEQHYWYVIGDTYYYNSTLTAYTYKGTKTFNLTNSDPNIIFAGIENGWDVQLNSVKWQGATYPTSYTADLRGGRDGSLEALPGSSDKYKFTLQVGDDTPWSETMPRSTSNDPTDALTSGPTTWTAYDSDNTTPRFNVQLLDNVNNCPEEHEEEYYNNHLSVPERVKLVIKATNGDDTKTYNVNLEIVYLQGPSFTGNVLLKNCALPGERIGFSSDGINIKTTDQLPVMSYGWKLVPLQSETYNEETHKMEYVWNTTNAIDIPSTCYNTAINGSVEGSIPALYSQNHWNIFYTFNAGGETFTVEPTKDDDAALSERMLVVHNYHKMADIATKYDVTVAPDIDPATVPGASAALIYAKALKPGAMIYLADDADIEAFVNYVNADNTTEGMHFYLQNDLTLPAAITKAFAGTLHGNGYSITMPTNGDSLFGDKLTGYVYNLGVPNGTIASTGTITNCFTSADDADDLRYGKKAYALSHHYTTTNAPGNYVHTLYANNDGMGGDWRYAQTSRSNSRYLRTTAPNYGNMQTSHNTNHAEAYELTRHDCLFFGQELAPTAEKKYPVHIDDEKISDSNWRETNRVYRTTGYYQSTTADKFHYNKVAWAMQPTLTAIDFTAENATVPDDSPSGFYGKTDDRPASLTSFSSDHNGTVTPYSNATTGKVTQNLLVYNSGGEAFNHKYLWGTAEETVQYHNILKSGSSATIDNFHLVDKQDFCAPIAFTVTNRAWYERKPDRFAENNKPGWEGICLPFTVQKAEASLNGEITHFYGEPGTTELLGGETEVAADYSNVDPAKNFHTLHHEYWLRGLVSVVTVPDVSPSGTTATFQRPGGEAPLFTQGTAAVNYEYNNTWFPKTYGTNYSGSVAQNNWYTTSHTYTDYKPLEKNIPYIVSFPGSRYYEFDLSSSFYNEKRGASADAQTITFSSASDVTIPATSAITTAAGSYVHTGTFLHVTDAEAYGMNNDGTQFGKGTTPTTVLPFRTYFKTTSHAPSKGIITIGDTETKIENIDISNHPNDGDDFADNDYLIVKPGYRCIVIESSCDRRLPCHGISGTSLGIWEVRRGTNTFSNLRTGIYIIGGKKVVVK